MDIIKRSNSQTHDYNNGAVQVTEFNFSDNGIMNDAEITIMGRYPMKGYAVNDISHALMSVESGSATFAVKGNATQHIEAGDRLLIEPGEPYALQTDGTLVIRYIASPAWKAEQSRVIE